MAKNKRLEDLNLTKTRKYLEGVIIKTGDILKNHFLKRNFSFYQKKGVDFTTDADIEADRFLREKIAFEYPTHHFLTVEAAPKDWSDFPKFENLWIIDSLDGTINFSRENPHFAISVAFVQRGKVVLGMVHVPFKGNLYWAQSDRKKAFLNKKPIVVSKTSQLRELVVGTDWGWDLKKRIDVVKLLKNICRSVRRIKSMGSAVADLASLAEGRIDVYFHSGLKPWDMAAASLLIEKAGGVITQINGKRWNPFCDNIFASNGVVHKTLLSFYRRNREK